MMLIAGCVIKGQIPTGGASPGGFPWLDALQHLGFLLQGMEKIPADLQVEPKLRGVAKEFAQAEGRAG